MVGFEPFLLADVPKFGRLAREAKVLVGKISVHLLPATTLYKPWRKVDDLIAVVVSRSDSLT